MKADLHIEPSLVPVWRSLGFPDGDLLGLGSAGAGGRGVVVAVTASPVDGSVVQDAPARFARTLGYRVVEVIAVHGSSVPEIVRDWLYQAAQGSGRGVSVQVTETSGALEVVVTSVDSSAREVAHRLASEHEPAVAALTTVLPHRTVEVRVAADD